MKVASINVSRDKGVAKTPVEAVVIDQNGLVGDAHAGPWHRQVSFLDLAQIEGFAAQAARPIKPGEFAENITTQGLDLGRLAVLDRVKIGAVELEVTQIGKECHAQACAIFRQVGRCLMPQEGVFSRVISGGSIKVGDAVEHRPRPLSFYIITLSDRAHQGVYEDKSGPAAQRILSEFLAGKRWHARLETIILPDDAARLDESLLAAKEAGGDVIITTGSTGVGPRDIAPETVTRRLDKLIPGVMEAIRIKCGAENPNALLTRSVAGVWGRSLVYVLPGSSKAVAEYLQEIIKTLEHLILMIHGIDAH